MMSNDDKATTLVDDKAKSVSVKTPSGPITVNKTVTIMRKDNSSAFYSRNAANMPDGRNKIGSAINSVLRMKANMDELNVYMPSMLAMNPNDPKYSEQVDLWFNNISKLVPEGGLPLNISFTYKDSASKKSVESIEEDIYMKFNRAKKNTAKELDTAIDIRERSIIELESTKYKYGSPVNVADYLLWRYCLVYSDVANDVAWVNKAGGIRFYIYDSVREKYKETLQFEVRNKATALYIKLLDTPDKATNILWADRGFDVDITALDKMDKYRMIENMSKADPANFISIYEDVNLETKAIVERMIHHGILRRLENTSVIVDENNDTIGNTMDEAIAFFKNTDRNKAAITRFKSKLKNYTNE